jgi:hypothetical protein
MKEKVQDLTAVENAVTAQKQPLAVESLGPCLQFQRESDSRRMDLVLSDGTKLTYESKEHFSEAFKKVTGTDDFEYSIALLAQVSRGMCDATEEQRLTRMSSLLPMLRPQDETEALLAGQFLTFDLNLKEFLSTSQNQTIQFFPRKFSSGIFLRVQRFTPNGSENPCVAGSIPVLAIFHQASLLALAHLPKNYLLPILMLNKLEVRLCIRLKKLD